MYSLKQSQMTILKLSLHISQCPVLIPFLVKVDVHEGPGESCIGFMEKPIPNLTQLNPPTTAFKACSVMENGRGTVDSWIRMYEAKPSTFFPRIRSFESIL